MRYRQGIFLYLIFFPAGLAILANAQRYPELRNQLHLSNGEFGTYLSLVGVGSFICFVVGSRMIHKFGVGRTLFIAILGLYSSVAAFPHFHNAFHFILINIIFGFFSTLNHISINAQGIHVQHKTGKLLLPLLSGIWSAGAVVTSLISITFAKYVSLAWQIDAIAAFGFCLALIGLVGHRNDLMDPKEEYEAAPTINFKNLLATFKFIPVLSFGHILIVQSEFSAGDWSAIFSHNVIGVSTSLAATSYLVFMIAMATLRIFAHKINFRYSEATLIKWVPRIGAIGFGTFLIFATYMAKRNLTLAFASTLIAYAFLGVGNSFIIGMLFGIAARKSQVMPGIVIASMGLVGAMLSFIFKIIISWVAQATTLTIALMIPTLMLFAGSWLYQMGEKQPAKN